LGADIKKIQLFNTILKKWIDTLAYI